MGDWQEPDGGGDDDRADDAPFLDDWSDEPGDDIDDDYGDDYDDGYDEDLEDEPDDYEEGE